MYIKNKELTMSGTVLIFQMISARDKKFGLYLPMQDGNVNSMLHRIYNNLENIDRVFMTLPPEKMCDAEQLEQLMYINSNFLDHKIVPVHAEELYGPTVAATRDIVSFQTMMPFIKTVSPSMIICEFPVYIHNHRGILENVEVKYNFNWNKVSDDDNSPSAQCFLSELAIAKRYETFLLSDVQYDYMVQHLDIESTSKMHRSAEIFSSEFTRKLVDYYCDLAPKNVVDYVKRLVNDDTFKEKGMLLHLSRIDDPRYKFEKVVEVARLTGAKLVVTNHLNSDIPDYAKDVDILDLSAELGIENTRSVYMLLLSNWQKHMTVRHYETDMHISTVEQEMLCSHGSVLYEASGQDGHTSLAFVINSYIKQSK